ncbi:trichothecene 3-O-acetyltransferase protein [Rutstroemia sp. NJR-2017a BVV2]|nr:trichothecene 3-O-acetyltransferase protein [Rutstroemia sp. NJR-2017a BVV2]
MQVMDATSKAPALLASELIGPKGWIRNVMCLELAADYDAGNISSMLRTAWSSFKTRTPMVGVEAVPADPDTKPAGQLKLQPYGDGEIEDFIVKDHRNDKTATSFGQLKEQGFPNAAMEDDTFCMRGRVGEWPNFGIDRLPTQMMQANLIKGGLLLNHLCFHSYADGLSMWKLAELFAEDLRRAQGLTIEKPVEIQVADRAKILQSTGENVCANFAEDHPEYIHLPFTPPGLPEGLTNGQSHAHVYRFTPEAIRALKDECSPAKISSGLKGKIPQEQLPKFISTNDALSALLWKSIQSAEHPDHSAVDPSKPSVGMVSLDARRRLHVPIHPHTLGNILGFTTAVLPIQQLISKDTPLADVACLVRQAVNKCGSTYYDELAHYIERMDDVNRLAGTAFLDMPGSNVLMSNWSEFDYYSIEWGPAFGDHIKSVRFPAGGVCAGFQVILPCPADAPEGTLEVLVCASNQAWPRLLRDEFFHRFAHNATKVPFQ